MAQLSWSLTALDNLEAIATHIELDSLVYASAFVQRVFDATDALKTFPNMGRVVPEYADQKLRELLFHGYRIVYQVDGEHARVLLVLHAARDMQQALAAEPWNLQ